MIIEFLPQLQTKTVVLASASPRRAALLVQLGLQNFSVVVSDFEENLPHSQYKQAADYAKATATHKVQSSAVKAQELGLRPDLIIAADTVVEHEGCILEKPADKADAIKMLSALSGSLHHVHTGVALWLPPLEGDADARIESFSETTDVEFAPLTEAAVHAYVETGEPVGKAGSYGIQGMAGTFVRRINGCYFNVVGFPVHAFSAQLCSLMQQGKLRL